MNIGGLGKLTNPGTILDLYRLASSNLIRNPLPVFYIDIAANRHGKSQGISPPGKLCHLASPHDPDYSRVQSSFLRRPRNTKQFTALQAIVRLIVERQCMMCIKTPHGKWSLTSRYRTRKVRSPVNGSPINGLYRPTLDDERAFGISGGCMPLLIRAMLWDVH